MKKQLSIVSLFSILCLVSVFLHGQSKPTGLMTDLLEHTETVYKNGFPTSCALSQVRDNSDYQFAEIRSSLPTFSWIVSGDKQNTYQTDYRIVLSTSYESTLTEKDLLWDSQVVKSPKSISITYRGSALSSNTTYYWKAKITNNHGESEWSEIKAFRTAGELSEYAVSYYPLTKSIEYPTNIIPIDAHNRFVDFGKAAFGSLQITLTSENGGDTVKVHLGEHQQSQRVDRKPPGTIRYQKHTLHLLKGTHTYQIQIAKNKLNTRPVAIAMPEYVGEVLPFRYCEIEGYDKALANTDIIRQSVHYPFDDSMSYFECSNDTLNQIWDLCKYSIKATSFTGIYVDGDRERIPYEADALINQLCHYGVDREYSMARRSHEYLLKYPTWPTEWIMQAVLIAWNDYLYTGDKRSLKANYEILKKRSLQDLTEKNGLISTRTGLLTKEFLAELRFGGEIRDIVDWPHTGILGLNKHEGGEADGFVFTYYNTVVNAYHYEALATMAKIAEVLNYPADSEQYKSKSNFLETLFLTSFFDNKKGYFNDGLDTEHGSLHSNMFPMAFDMIPDKNKQSVLNFIKSRGMACSVYGSQFLMDALYDANDAEYGLAMLTKTDDRSWYNMIKVGSTISLEAWDNKYKPNQDWNHAWGAVPANTIPRKLIGIEPLIPGFSQIRLKPQIDKLSWVKSRVPTIRGTIDVDIINTQGRYEMNVSIPANMEAEVYLPLLSRKYSVTRNNQSIKGKQLKNEPFINLGLMGSGNYTFVMEY